MQNKQIDRAKKQTVPSRKDSFLDDPFLSRSIPSFDPTCDDLLIDQELAMTFRFPDMVPGPDSDLDPAADEHFDWILAWYLAEDRALRAFEAGDTDSDDPDENGYLTEQKWDEEDDPEPLDVNDDPDRDTDDDGIA